MKFIHSSISTAGQCRMLYGRPIPNDIIERLGTVELSGSTKRRWEGRNLSPTVSKGSIAELDLRLF